jgi:hypothetical protein
MSSREDKESDDLGSGVGRRKDIDMKPFSVHPIVKESFSIAARQEGNTIFVKISGNGDMEAPVTLGVYLKKVHGEAQRLGTHRVVLECDELYFMSSACIKCLTMWIESILKLDPMDRYKVKFQSNPNLPWQRRSFETVRRFAPALVHVDTDSIQTPSAAQVAAMPASGTVPSAGAAPSGTIRQSGSVPQTPAARRKS